MTNAASRRNVQASGSREKVARRFELDAVRFVMSNPAGRAFIWRLLDKTGVEGLVQMVPNAMQLAGDVATQNVGKFVLLEVREACPETEILMRREAAKAVDIANKQEELEDGNHDNRD